MVGRLVAMAKGDLSFFLRDHKGKGRKEVGKRGREAPLGGEEGGPHHVLVWAGTAHPALGGPPTWLDLSLLLSRSLASFPPPPVSFYPLGSSSSFAVSSKSSSSSLTFSWYQIFERVLFLRGGGRP